MGFAAGIRLVWILCVPLVFFYFLCPDRLLRVFMEEPTAEAMQTGVRFLKILSPFYFVVSAKLVADGILRGAGEMKPFIIATFTDLALRVLLAFILSGTPLAATGIWCAWPVGWCIAALLSVFFYRSECGKRRSI